MRKLLGAFACGVFCACSVQAIGTEHEISQSAIGASDAPIATAEQYLEHCGICHLEAGQGVPGAFPPLDERLADWATSENGQGYLVSVIANGLYGVLRINGEQYAGAMPGLAGQLTAAEMAGLLNFVLVDFAGGEANFTQDSVATYLGQLGNGPSLPLRPE